MANKIVLRVGKVKTADKIKQILNHNFRLVAVPNANPEQSKNNFNLRKVDDVRQHIDLAFFTDDAIHKKRRKDAVLCMDYLISASPDFFKTNSPITQMRFFEEMTDWLKKRHGAENVLSVNIHYDETTPHMHALVIPTDPRTGKLSCDYHMGNKTKMRQMQTDIAQAAAKFGLERGESGSKAKHTSIKKFYGLVEEAVKQADLRKATAEQETQELTERTKSLNRRVNKLNDWVNRQKNGIFGTKIDLDELKTLVTDVVERKNDVFRHVERATERFNGLNDDLTTERVNHALTRSTRETTRKDADYWRKQHEAEAKRKREYQEKAEKLQKEAERTYQELCENQEKTKQLIELTERVKDGNATNTEQFEYYFGDGQAIERAISRSRERSKALLNTHQNQLQQLDRAGQVVSAITAKQQQRTEQSKQRLQQWRKNHFGRNTRPDAKATNRDYPKPKNTDNHTTATTAFDGTSVKPKSI